ncbi:MAG: hypothetical protein ACM3QS_02665 [Bacteroidota bacterium]
MANRVFGSYRSMSILALVVGIVTVALQFLPGFELISFMLAVVTLGSLVGAEGSYAERDRQLLGRSYKFTLEWLLLAVMAAYALLEVSKGFGILQASTAFLDDHWPGLIFSAMCLLMGLAGLHKPAPAFP